MRGHKKMPNKWTLTLYTAIITIIISLNGGLAFAGNYKVGWWWVHKRINENGTSYNRLAFSILDESDNPVLTDVVQGIALIGPNGSVLLDPYDFDTYEMLYGSIETGSGQWNYDSEFSTENIYIANFSEDPVEGNYSLFIIDTDGVDVSVASNPRYYNGVVELPKISSKTFRGYEDADGNLFWQWDPPTDTAVWSQSLDVSIRCWLGIYDGDDPVAQVYVTVPATLGGMYVPKNIMDLVRQKGDWFYVQLHLRTNDNDNRYYTNGIPLSSLKKERSVKTVVIPLL
jgi:hypothetical protein